MIRAVVQIVLNAIVLTCLVLSPAMAQEDSFITGNKYYEEGDYESAIKMYNKVLESGIESAALYYNLANAYFKNGDLGRTVLHYNRAIRLNPSDPDIQNNLEFARRYVNIHMEGVELNPVDGFFKTIVGNYRLNTLGWLASFLFIIFVGLLILKYGLQFYFSGIDAALIVSICLVVTFAGLTTFKYRTDYLDKRAVILSENASVYSGPSTNADLELTGSPGLVVEIVEESGDYYSVLFENKRRGWINKSLVAEI